MPRNLVLLACSFVSALTVVLLAPSPALAYGPFQGVNPMGTDISWPQCGTGYPGGYSYAVIGVTGGEPFTTNPCLGSEVGWAVAWNLHPQLYINLDFGQASRGPLSCLDGDASCQAYNYGWDAAANAWQQASPLTGTYSTTVGAWWLDIETENVWADDTLQNSYVIQGAIDYLQRMQGRTVGVYSTAHMWQEIAGSYAPPGVPNWVAGADSVSNFDYCHWPIWPGATVWQIQYLNYDLNLDEDRAC